MSIKNLATQDLLLKVRSPKQRHLVARISLFAFILQFVSYVINATAFKHNDAASLICSEIGTISFFCFLGLAGFIVIIRKELPQAITVKGKLAVFYGLIWCSFSWGLAARYIYLLINDIARLLS